ncbi:UNVERIFIED_CONTAM: hypothetical protein B566_EDAN018190 [Ephemera danica]|nr:hypothetical protein B566_EDAN018190 [Ephemera danica]
MCTTYSWSAVKAVLIDLSGTLHIENTAIAGAVEALERLRGSGLPVKFVTNTTKESSRVLHSRLVNLGFRVDKDEIYSSLRAARRLIDERKLNPLLLVDPAAEEDFQDLVGSRTADDKYNAVLVGLAPDRFDYVHLNRAFRLLLDGASLIAIHKARYYKREDGLALGPGPFVAALEYATGVEAEVVGKPTETFFRSSLKGFNDVQPHEVVMIGDDVKDDVVGAINAGLAGILVRTGKYREGDEISLPCGGPCSVVPSFPEATI